MNSAILNRFVRIILLAALATYAWAANSAAQAGNLDTQWLLNGAQKVVWSTTGSPTHGARQEIRLVEPVDGSDSVVFTGWRTGRTIKGSARYSVPGCNNSFSYTMTGWINADETLAVLQGGRPVVDNCKVVRHVMWGEGAHIRLSRKPAPANLF